MQKKPTGGVKIGNNTAIAAQCYIIDSNHGSKAGVLVREQPMETEKVEIGDDVWIAANCQIIKGACVESGAIIGAGSVVNSKIPKNTIAVGAPARVLRAKNVATTACRNVVEGKDVYFE